VTQNEQRAAWRKSTYSEQLNNCVEVAPFQDLGVGVRDSKLSHSPTQTYTPAAWAEFVTAAR